MSDRESRKRDWFFSKLRGTIRPESPVEGKAGLHSIGESSTHTPTTASSAPSVARLKKTTPSTATSTPLTQHQITPTAPQLKPQPEGAVGNQPGPTSTTAAAMDTAHENEEGPAQSLWKRAINSDKLSSQERKTLAGIGPGVDSQTMASTVSSMTDGILNEKKKKRELWKVRFRGEDVVLPDVGMKILRWIDKFKNIGDIIVQYDPVHAALPWAGFRFLLQVSLNR